MRRLKPNWPAACCYAAATALAVRGLWSSGHLLAVGSLLVGLIIGCVLTLREWRKQDRLG